MSTLKVNTIQDTTGNDALTIDSSGNVTASQGFVPSSQLSHRNLIINGAMQVAQRGTSFTETNPGGTTFYYLDRFCMQSDLPQITYTVEQSSDAPTGFSNSLKVQVTSPASSTFPDSATRYFRMRHKIEAWDARSLLNKNITLSFWVKSSITGKFDVTFFASDSASSANHNVNPYTINTANTWEKKEITIAAPAVINNDGGDGLDIQFQLAKAGSNFQTSSTGVWGGVKLSSTDSTADLANTTNATFQITGVQLEEGSVATPFEHRSYGEELARCQRYYATGKSRLCFNGTSGRYGFRTIGQHNMRTTPTVTGSFASQGMGTILAYGSDQVSADSPVKRIHVQTVVGSGADGQFTYTADAEL